MKTEPYAVALLKKGARVAPRPRPSMYTPALIPRSRCRCFGGASCARSGSATCQPRTVETRRHLTLWDGAHAARRVRVVHGAPHAVHGRRVQWRAVRGGRTFEMRDQLKPRPTWKRLFEMSVPIV